MAEAPDRSKGRREMLVRGAKVRALQGLRLARWAWARRDFPPPTLAPDAARFPHLWYQRSVSLARVDPGADPVFEAGKAHNVALAAPAFDDLLLAPGRPLSFWRTLGRVTAARGFRHGMELRAGCAVATVGGGLCLLSNALFQLACELGFTILERHGHTVEAVPLPPGQLDATVLWPYVDLRFEPRDGAVRLEVAVHDRALKVSAWGEAPCSVRAELRVDTDGLVARGADSFRRERVVRTLLDARTGEVLEVTPVAHNFKRLLHPVEVGRSCLTCGVSHCHEWQRVARERAG